MTPEIFSRRQSINILSQIDSYDEYNNRALILNRLLLKLIFLLDLLFIGTLSSNPSRPSNVHPVSWPSWLLSVRPITPTKGWYPLPIPVHSSNSNPIPLLQYVHNIPVVPSCASWPPSTTNVQPIRGRIAIYDTLPIRGTTTSPAMPRLGDRGCVCVVVRFGLGPLLLSFTSYCYTNVISPSLARSCLSLCFPFLYTLASLGPCSCDYVNSLGVRYLCDICPKTLL